MQSTPAVSLQGAPAGLRGAHWPKRLQYCAAPHVKSLAQGEFVHDALVPVQAVGVQGGLPAKPAFAIVHLPFCEAPSAAEQTSHESVHAASQQYPSTQYPGAWQAWQPVTLQSAPAARLQAVPTGLRMMQVPEALQ
jgi:hypothetical protein